MVWGDDKDYFGENFFSSDNFRNIIQMSTSNHLIFFRDNVEDEDKDMYQILFIHSKCLTDENFEKKIVKEDIKRIKQIYQTEKYFLILKLSDYGSYSVIHKYIITDDYNVYNSNQYSLDNNFLLNYYSNENNNNIKLISANDKYIIGLLNNNENYIKYNINGNNPNYDRIYEESNIYDIGINYYLKDKKIYFFDNETLSNKSININIDDVKIENNIMYIIDNNFFRRYNLENDDLITYNALQ